MDCHCMVISRIKIAETLSTLLKDFRFLAAAFKTSESHGDVYGLRSSAI